MPFWSLQSRAETIVRTVSAYAEFEVVSIPLDEWRNRWLPGLRRDGIRVGLNWSGARATGYDLEAQDVERNLRARGSVSQGAFRKCWCRVTPVCLWSLGAIR